MASDAVHIRCHPTSAEPFFLLPQEEKDSRGVRCLVSPSNAEPLDRDYARPVAMECSRRAVVSTSCSWVNPDAISNSYFWPAEPMMLTHS